MSNIYVSPHSIKPRKTAGANREYQGLAIPIDIVRLLPPGLVFSVELNEDGLLYRPTISGSKRDLPLPGWATRNGS